MAFRHMLFWHVGDTSAVGNSQRRHKPKCYGLTREWLFEQESFHVDECPHDDLWPCAPYAPASHTPRAAALHQLSEQSIADAGGGAAHCGVARVCWRRPDAGTLAAQCAARRRLDGKAAPEYARTTGDG